MKKEKVNFVANVSLNLLNIFALRTNEKSIEYEGKTVRNVLSQFLISYKDKLDDSLLSKNKKKLNSQILVLLNGRNINYLKKYKTKLNDGDKIYLSAPIAGG